MKKAVLLSEFEMFWNDALQYIKMTIFQGQRGPGDALWNILENVGQGVYSSQQYKSQRARKLKKVQAKKHVKSNK